MAPQILLGVLLSSIFAYVAAQRPMFLDAGNEIVITGSGDRLIERLQKQCPIANSRYTPTTLGGVEVTLELSIYGFVGINDAQQTYLPFRLKYLF